MQYGFKKAQNLKLISNPLKKLQKISREKSCQGKSDKNGVFFTFITLLTAKIFGLCGIFFGDSTNFAFYMYNTHIEFKK
jgi:hypothetical protein